jgi:hypothetical protein
MGIDFGWLWQHGNGAARRDLTDWPSSRCRTGRQIAEQIAMKDEVHCIALHCTVLHSHHTRRLWPFW